jgi:hypothetical protein
MIVLITGRLWAKCRALYCEGEQAVAHWLRHYATRRKVAGSKPQEENEFLQYT